MDNERRKFLGTSAAIGIAALAASAIPAWAQPGRGDDNRRDDNRHDNNRHEDRRRDDDETPAAEVLMRDHGVLDRLLLIYEEGLRRARDRDDLAADVFLRPARLVRRFVEDYHQRMEETFIFPEFIKHRKHGELLRVLTEQHQAGRQLTDSILRIAGSGRMLRNDDARRELSRACSMYIRMSRPHTAREETRIFPDLAEIVPARRLTQLGDQFDREERRQLGGDAFPKIVAQVHDIEEWIGVEELKKYTPPM